MHPIIIATQKGCPKSKLFCIPAMVNRANPNVSNTNHVFFKRSIYLEKAITMQSAIAVHIIYMELVIQKGVAPNIISRIVPPPMATAIPHTYPPNQSNRFAAACLIPEIAKAKVPRNSINC